MGKECHALRVYVWYEIKALYKKIISRPEVAWLSLHCWKIAFSYVFYGVKTGASKWSGAISGGSCCLTFVEFSNRRVIVRRNPLVFFLHICPFSTNFHRILNLSSDFLVRISTWVSALLNTRYSWKLIRDKLSDFCTVSRLLGRYYKIKHSALSDRSNWNTIPV